MWQYVINRLILSIPTVFLVLIMAFVLQSLSSVDEVDKLLAIDGASAYQSPTDYLESYESLSKLSGSNKTTFYFSIAPDYIPIDVHQIIPQETRKNAIRIARESRSPQNVKSVYSNIDILIRKSEKEKTLELTSQLLRLKSSANLSELKERSQAMVIPSNAKTEISVTLNQLATDINQLTQSGGWVFPSIRWHGRNNRFHNFIKSGILSGRSLLDGAPVVSKIIKALRWTLTISLLSLALIASLTIIISYFQIIGGDKVWERLSSGFFYLLYAMPLFWIATIMVVFFTTKEYGAWTDWFPSVGIRIGAVTDNPWALIFQNLDRLILPILCTVLHVLAFTTQQMKGEMKQQLQKPYVLVAKSRGLSFLQLVRNHVIPNSLVAYITIMTGRVASLFSGAIIIEYIFNIPGIGRLLFDSIYQSDWPVIFGILILISIATILGFLLGDILHTAVNPKLKHKMLAS